jgi:hypothetical protein
MSLMNLSCGEIFLSSLLKILINKPSVHSKDSENDNYVSIVAKKDEFDFRVHSNKQRLSQKGISGRGKKIPTLHLEENKNQFWTKLFSKSEILFVMDQVNM